jgi:hypothetical protein
MMLAVEDRLLYPTYMANTPQVARIRRQPQSQRFGIYVDNVLIEGGFFSFSSAVCVLNEMISVSNGGLVRGR